MFKNDAVYSVDDIIEMYKAEEVDGVVYDSDEIATIICEKIIDTDTCNESQFRDIYIVFDICKQYVKSTYE